VIRLKDGVSLRKLRPQAGLLAVVMDQTYQANGINVCVITSGDDGTHKRQSKHYDGDALDFRTRDMTRDRAIKIVAEVRASLGRDFDVILEDDHVHGEWDPKEP
jgi:hypothetical protein